MMMMASLGQAWCDACQSLLACHSGGACLLANPMVVSQEH